MHIVHINAIFCALHNNSCMDSNLVI